MIRCAIGKVLVNLGNNAVKFTEKGEIVVGVERTGGDGSSVELHFWVKDSGIGMSRNSAESCSAPSARPMLPPRASTAAAAWALVISGNLVEIMGGRIWVESEPGKGSTFHFSARFGLQEGPQARRMFRADELLGVRVLVVDDNAAAREILSTMARSFGWKSTWHGTARRRWRWSPGRNSPCRTTLVLMDWKILRDGRRRNGAAHALGATEAVPRGDHGDRVRTGGGAVQRHQPRPWRSAPS
ncbi:hypothetical protein H1235_04750 [Pseudoxanthomonas sp. NC8]|nr:hypothetical protein H1235_04750 [Pseudoxanthomonas sp. NC8]